MQDFMNEEYSFDVPKDQPVLVAVKMLRSDASKNARRAAFVIRADIREKSEHLFNMQPKLLWIYFFLPSGTTSLKR